MPPKKTVTVQKVTGDGGPVLSEGSDPVQTAVNIIDKKVRNLEKRKVHTLCSLFLPSLLRWCLNVHAVVIGHWTLLLLRGWKCTYIVHVYLTWRQSGHSCCVVVTVAFCTFTEQTSDFARECWAWWTVEERARGGHCKVGRSRTPIGTCQRSPETIQLS